MNRSLVLAFQLLVLSAFSPVLAQRGGPPRGGDSGVPAVGTMLPVVSAYDEQGNEFSTATLKGSYTVLVFGCLT